MADEQKLKYLNAIKQLTSEGRTEDAEALKVKYKERFPKTPEALTMPKEYKKLLNPWDVDPAVAPAAAGEALTGGHLAELGAVLETTTDVITQEVPVSAFGDSYISNRNANEDAIEKLEKNNPGF